MDLEAARESVRPGNESALGNVYSSEVGPVGGPYPMEDDDFANEDTDDSHSTHEKRVGDAVMAIAYDLRKRRRFDHASAVEALSDSLKMYGSVRISSPEGEWTTAGLHI